MGKAEEHLDFAFIHCTTSSRKNKRLILQYLLPLKILLGKLPSDALLQKYNMDEYQDIAQAVRQGKLDAYNQAMTEHQQLFVQRGVYLILEKAKILAFRNFFKRIQFIVGSNKVPLAQCKSGLQTMNIDMSVDEIECILANLIFEGYIKGYVAHKAKYLVVSAKNAFPKVT